MAKVKLRVELNKGRRGIALGKLSKITQETLHFLSMVYRDAELPGDPDGWLAVNFDNESVDFDCESFQDVELLQEERAKKVLHVVMTNDRTSDFGKRVVRDATRRQYSQIASAIEPDEKVTFRLFQNGDVDLKDTHELTRSVAYEIELQLPSSANYHGEIQGAIHSLFKEERPRRIRVRELSTGDLVDCQFDDELYHNLIDVLKEPRGIVFIEGEIHENLASGAIDAIKAKSFRLAPAFDEERFNSLIGCAPNLTGDLTTEEFVERFRDNGGRS
jgi:hypothetical protein